MTTTQTPPRAGDFVLAARQCELNQMEAFLMMGNVLTAVTGLVHDLQRERGASCLFTGSQCRHFGARRRELVAATDMALTPFYRALADIQDNLLQNPVDSRLLQRLAMALLRLDHLSALRTQVEQQALDTLAIADDYSQIIRCLIQVVFDAAEMVADPELAERLIALVHLMNGKEFAGQERATGAAGFAQAEFPAGLSHRMADLQDAQARCFDTFTDFAGSDVIGEWDAILGHPREEEINRLRRQAHPKALHQADPEALADHWFQLITERLDAFKQLEDSLERAFHQGCVERYQQLKASLSEQATLLEELSAAPADTANVMVICEPGKALRQEQSGADRKLGHSLFDLVQQEHNRLALAEAELTRARAALEERKVLEKAVATVMRDHGISNDEAHRVLRKLAMDRGQSLATIASQLAGTAR